MSLGGTGTGSLMPGMGGKYQKDALATLLGKTISGLPPPNPGNINPATRPLPNQWYRPGGILPPGGNPTQRPPGPTTPPPGNVPGAPAGGSTVRPNANGNGLQPGAYTTGRTGDGSQTQIMSPDVQAWIYQMLHGPGLNTGWRQNANIDPNNILASIEQASGQKYVPGGHQAPIPGLGY